MQSALNYLAKTALGSKMVAAVCIEKRARPGGDLVEFSTFHSVLPTCCMQKWFRSEKCVKKNFFDKPLFIPEEDMLFGNKHEKCWWLNIFVVRICESWHRADASLCLMTKVNLSALLTPVATDLHDAVAVLCVTSLACSRSSTFLFVHIFRRSHSYQSAANSG